MALKGTSRSSVELNPIHKPEIPLYFTTVFNACVISEIYKTYMKSSKFHLSFITF